MALYLLNAFCMNPGLWVSEFGILLELGGALWIVIAAFRNRKRVKGLDGTYAGMVKLPEVEKAIRGQAITEFWGFSLLGIGLIFQFVGGLPVF